MSLIELISWVVLGLLLATLHVSIPREHPLHAGGVFLSGIVGSLLGGYLVRIVHTRLLSVGGYSVLALIAAGTLAELFIRWSTWGNQRKAGPRTT
jgi:hypothetical protein